MKTKKSPFKLYYFRRLNSTNLKAKQFNENSAILAGIQAKGRGRFKRAWSSKQGGIYLSIVLKPEKEPSKLTLLTSLAVQRAIKKTYGINPLLKWPNDLIYNKKKLCGILTENIYKKNKLEKTIIGIGINTNNKIPENLINKAISLKQVLGKKIDNKKLINQLLNQFYILYKKYNKNKFNVIQNWKKSNSLIGKNVKVKTINSIYYGKAIDLDNSCNLILKSKNKTIRIREGDISIIY